MRHTLGYAVFCFAFLVVFLTGLQHCATFDHGMADTAYTTEQLRCVDNNNTKPEIDACRRAVRLKWGIVEFAGDAGHD